MQKVNPRLKTRSCAFLFHFQFQPGHRLLSQCHCTFGINGPLAKKGSYRFLKDCLLTELLGKTSKGPNDGLMSFMYYELCIMYCGCIFIFQSVAESAAKQDDDSMLKCLIDLAENCPKYLRHQLEAVINLCMKVYHIFV